MKIMDNGKLGKFLAELRKEKGLTQEQLAELINSDNKTISKWETGRYTPSVDYITKLSELYNISTVEIMQCKRNTIEESIDEEKDKNLLNNIAKYNNIIKRRTICFGLIILITVTMTFIITIYNIKSHEWRVVDLTESNDKYYVEGNIIYNNNTIIYNIKELQLSSDYIGTIKEPKVKHIEISLYYDDKQIILKSDEYEEAIFIHKALQNVFLSEKVDCKYKKDGQIKIVITYYEKNDDKNTEVILLNEK